MRISLDIIKEKYQLVIKKKWSFEEASSWATKVIELDEFGQIEYDSNENISEIFSALKFLVGVDLQVSPDEYLFAIEDVKDKYQKIFGDP